MRYELDDYTRNISDAELTEDLRRVAQLLGKKSVTIDEYSDHGRCHASTLQRRFGSWFAALDKAGLERTRVLGITGEELFENLAEIWIRLGRQPRYGDVERPLSRFSVGTYEKRFGGWRKALEAFVEYANSEETPAVLSTHDAAEAERRPRQTGRKVSLRLRFQILSRDGFRCRGCGRSPATEPGVELQVDHISPWSKGGDTDLSNLQALCRECNAGKGDLSNESG